MYVLDGVQRVTDVGSILLRNVQGIDSACISLYPLPMFVIWYSHK